MAEPSSSSSSPLHDSFGTPRGKRYRIQKHRLEIEDQPPEFIFSGEKFEFTVAIKEDSSPSASPLTDIKVLTSLTSNTSEAHHDCSLHLLETPRLSRTRKTGTIKCIITNRKISQRHGCSVQICLTGDENIEVAPTNTRTICLVNAKLKVAMVEDYTKWYKDEGGREKCMEAIVSVLNERHELITEDLVLDLALCYYRADRNHVLVSNERILTLIGLGPDTHFQIDGRTGKGKVRYRIQEVSRNHQGQDFVLRISPEKGSRKDIAPAFTDPVNVLSKKSSKKQEGKSQKGKETKAPARAPIQQPLRFEGDPARFRQAVDSVSRWVEDVANSLSRMKWQFVGYEKRSDGSDDYTRPVHTNIWRPNLEIERILGEYKRVQVDLGFLQNAITGDLPHPSAQAQAAMSTLSHRPIYDRTGVTTQATSTRAMEVHTGDYNFFPSPPPHQSQQQQQHYPIRPPYQHPPFFYPSDQQQSIEAKLTSSDPSSSNARRIESNIDREREIEFVLAKHFKAVLTEELLGFPAYSANHEILGFYREETPTHIKFVPLSTHDFGTVEKENAKKILEEAIQTGSDAVQALKTHGTITNLVHACVVHAFKKDVDDSPIGDANLRPDV